MSHLKIIYLALALSDADPATRMLGRVLGEVTLAIDRVIAAVAAPPTLVSITP